MEGQHAQTLFEAAIFPALSGFVLCLAFVLIAAWRPAGRPGPWEPLTPGRRRRLLRTTGLLAALGTLGFGAIVLGYSVILQHEPGATSAVWGGAFLLAVAAVVWGGLTVAVDRAASARGRARSTIPDPAPDGARPRARLPTGDDPDATP